jgi:hypothetical protein
MKARRISAVLFSLLLALSGSVYGDTNVVSGDGAGQSCDTCGFEVLLGYYAGALNVSNFYNTYVGAWAGNGCLGCSQGSTGSENTFIGSGAGTYINHGSQNTFVGRSAGEKINDGNTNSFIGYKAGYSNTDGSDNTFLGMEAGYSNTTGQYNVFAGHQAGYYTTGNSNTFVGQIAGYWNTSGHDNTFLGQGAGTSNETASANTFLGVSAGYSNKTGASNTFVGLDSGHGNIDGNFNSFFGRAAGTSNTSGGWNTFIGVDAGFTNSDGEQNTFVGGGAGRTNDIGSNNTFVGYQTGYSTNGDGNVFLGYQAGYSETGSDKLYIANSWTGSPLIYGDFSTHQIVIHGVFSIASSQAYKERIEQLRPEKAIETLKHLNPVEFSYRTTPADRHTGFISEEVPESMTAKERKAVSPMDIVAVLTKVVQEQQGLIKDLQRKNDALEQRLLALETK